MTQRHPTFRDVLQARRRIAGTIRTTPLAPSPSLTKSCGVPVTLKLEHHQVTGSFKLRGATNAVLALGDEDRARGVIGVSTGNHGRGLAQACKANGVACAIFMSELVPANKIAAIEALGAEIRIVGRSQDDAQVAADEFERRTGRTMLPPFDHADIIAGQATLGLEIVEQMPEVATLVVPLSGGGLIAGIALAAKTLNSQIRVIGVSMERGAAMIEALRAGEPVSVEELPTLADSLGGGIGLDNRHTFEMVRDLVDEAVLVSEAEIADAIRHAYEHERQILEGGGAVPIAALKAGKIEGPGPIVAVLSGGNIDMALHRRIIIGENVDPAAE